MTPQTKFINSMLWNQLGRIVEIVLSLLFTILIVRLLSTAEYNTYTTIVNFVVILTMLGSLGLSDGLLRYVPVVQKIDAATPFWLLRRFLLIRSAVFISASILIWLSRGWLARWFNQPLLDTNILFFILLYFLFLSLSDLFIMFFISMFWTREIVLIRLLGQLLSLIIALVWHWLNLLSPAMLFLNLFLTYSFIFGACSWLLLKKGLFRPVLAREFWDSTKTIFSFCRDLWLTLLVTLGLAGQADVVILAMTVQDDRAVPYYSLAALLITRIYVLITAWSGSLNSIVSTVFVEKGQTGLVRYFNYYYRFSLPIYLIPMLGLGCVAGPLTTLLFGERYSAVAGLIILFVGQHTLAALSADIICISFSNTLERQRTMLIIRIVLSSLNIGLDFWLAPIFGATGPVLATLICNSLLYLSQIVLLKDLFSKLKLDYPAKIATIVLSGSVLASLITFENATLPTLVVRGTFYLLYVGFLLLFFKPLEPEDKQLLLNLRPGLARFIRFL
jgi:O-antigen/teichoic acid export membrane protein